MRKFVCIAALMLAGCSSATPTPSPSLLAPTPTSSLAPSATPSSAAATASPAPATGSLTMHLLERAENVAAVQIFSITDCKAAHCLGDYIVGNDPLFGAATGKEVGTLAFECFLVDVASTLMHCPGNTITLTDRGQIVFAEVLEHEVGRPAEIAPITGGTGEFLGVTGTVTSRKLASGGDFVITISP